MYICVYIPLRYLGPCSFGFMLFGGLRCRIWGSGFTGMGFGALGLRVQDLGCGDYG